MKKILIVDDDLVIRNELKEILDNANYETIVLDDFTFTYEKILTINPDLILLDINIPKLNGQILLQKIRKESDIPIIMVTSKNNEVDEVLSMSYGADDYITKPYNPTILLLRIQNIFKRMNNYSDTLIYNNISINPSRCTLSSTDKVIELTKNEMIIFMQLFNNRNKIVTRSDLMTNLWDNQEYINDNALTVNISRLRLKLSELGLDDAIETKKGLGYILL